MAKPLEARRHIEELAARKLVVLIISVVTIPVRKEKRVTFSVPIHQDNYRLFHKTVTADGMEDDDG